MVFWRAGNRATVRTVLLLVGSFWLGTVFQRFSSRLDDVTQTIKRTRNQDTDEEGSCESITSLTVTQLASSVIRPAIGQFSNYTTRNNPPHVDTLTQQHSVEDKKVSYGTGKVNAGIEQLNSGIVKKPKLLTRKPIQPAAEKVAKLYDSITGVRDGGEEGMLECTWMTKKRWRPHYDKHEYKYIINPENACQFDAKSRGNVTILILINTGLAYVKRRDAQRKTWISWSREHRLPVRILYLMGASDNETEMQQIRAESDLYQDIIQEDFIGVYLNNTLKTVMAFKWASTFCSNVDFVMKVDDDTVLNVPNLVRDLAKAPPEFRHSYVAGSPLNYKPIRGKGSVYCMPKAFYAREMYPTFPQGAGYVFSIDMAGKLFKASQETLLFAYDDVFVGMLLKIVGVEIKQRSSFQFGYKFRSSRGRYQRTAPSLLALQKGYITWDIYPPTVHYVWDALLSNSWTNTDRVFQTKCNMECVEKAGYLP